MFACLRLLDTELVLVAYSPGWREAEQKAAEARQKVYEPLPAETGTPRWLRVGVAPWSGRGLADLSSHVVRPRSCEGEEGQARGQGGGEGHSEEARRVRAGNTFEFRG